MTVTPIRDRGREAKPYATRSCRLRVTCRNTGSDVSVSVRGEVDTHNGKEFAVAVCDAASRADHVTVDLSELGFMAIDGVAALHAINAQLSRASTPWRLVPGAAASRVLELCDPEGLIPVGPPALGVAQSA
ncbi:STAS domain-containing protein [Mycobacterium sp. NPDC048908]|uniref:STAS domain-containing protein n=1 Tax=Mycobacterium sp. NPDC048908 TaxID=3364292 RepID=UPI00371164A6